MQHRDLLLRVVAMLTKMVRGTTYVARSADMRSIGTDQPQVVVSGTR